MHIECKNEATYRAMFVIHSKTSIEPASAMLDIYCCSEHATKEEADRLLVDNIPWRRMIEDAFEKQGLAAPDWNRSHAEWVKL